MDKGCRHRITMVCNDSYIDAEAGNEATLRSTSEYLKPLLKSGINKVKN